ncbi:hypothetical protein D3C72_1997810 [compost metagenome]
MKYLYLDAGLAFPPPITTGSSHVASTAYHLFSICTKFQACFSLCPEEFVPIPFTITLFTPTSSAKYLKAFAYPSQTHSFVINAP